MTGLMVLIFAFVVGSSPAQIPQGSGKLAPDYLKETSRGAAAFIYSNTDDPCAPPVPNHRILPKGSGFFVWLDSGKKDNRTGRDLGLRFLVTAQHVVGKDNVIRLRLNRTDSEKFKCSDVELVASGKTQNIFRPNDASIDLVAIHVPDIPDTDPVDFDTSLILDPDRMKELNIGIGTEVFTVGYLYGYSGETQNHPVTKFGRIALITEEQWLLSDRDQYEQAYLIELQNTPGLSGAPVLSYPLQLRPSGDGQHIQYSLLPPLVVGVIKDLLTVPLTPKGPVISQGVAAIEPAKNLKTLMEGIRKNLAERGSMLQ